MHTPMVRRIAAGWAEANRIINAALLRLMFDQQPPSKPRFDQDSAQRQQQQQQPGADAVAHSAQAASFRRLMVLDKPSKGSNGAAWLRRLLLSRIRSSRRSSAAGADTAAGTAGADASQGAAVRQGASADAAEGAKVMPGASVSALADGQGLQALEGPTRPATPPELQLQQCLLLNASICAPTVATHDGSEWVGFMAVVYNPLSWFRREGVRVPVPPAFETFVVTGRSV